MGAGSDHHLQWTARQCYGQLGVRAQGYLQGERKVSGSRMPGAIPLDCS